MGVMATFNLAGRRALVTGSSRGIGAALALALAEAGADVAVHCAGRQDAASKVADRISAMGRRAPVLTADLTDAAAPQQLAQRAVEALGGIDILIANASVQLAQPWAEVTREQFDQHIAVNVRSTFELIQALTPAMAQRGWGRILTIGSVQETRPHPQMVIYAASKSAQTSLVRNLAKQLAPRGITVNNLAPGVIDTDRNRAALAQPEYRAQVLDRIPAQRLGQPEDCAGAALLLCSDAGSYITGQSLFVDGGFSL